MISIIFYKFTSWVFLSNFLKIKERVKEGRCQENGKEFFSRIQKRNKILSIMSRITKRSAVPNSKCKLVLANTVTSLICIIHWSLICFNGPRFEAQEHSWIQKTYTLKSYNSKFRLGARPTIQERRLNISTKVLIFSRNDCGTVLIYTFIWYGNH